MYGSPSLLSTALLVVSVDMYHVNRLYRDAENVNVLKALCGDQMLNCKRNIALEQQKPEPYIGSGAM
jgi:hypothetical protein